MARKKIKVGDFVVYKKLIPQQLTLEPVSPENFHNMYLEKLTYGKSYQVLGIPAYRTGYGPPMLRVLNDCGKQDFPLDEFDYDIKKYRKAKLTEIYGAQI